MEDVLQQIPGANQSQLGKHRMEKFFMLMRVTVCYRTKLIDKMAAKKREMNSAFRLWSNLSMLYIISKMQVLRSLKEVSTAAG